MTFDGAWYISTPGSEGRCRYPNSDCLAYQRSSEKDDFEWFQIKTVTSSRRLESPLMIVDRISFINVRKPCTVIIQHQQHQSQQGAFNWCNRSFVTGFHTDKQSFPDKDKAVAP